MRLLFLLLCSISGVLYGQTGTGQLSFWQSEVCVGDTVLGWLEVTNPSINGRVVDSVEIEANHPAQCIGVRALGLQQQTQANKDRFLIQLQCDWRALGTCATLASASLNNWKFTFYINGQTTEEYVHCPLEVWAPLAAPQWSPPSVLCRSDSVPLSIQHSQASKLFLWTEQQVQTITGSQGTCVVHAPSSGDSVLLQVHSMYRGCIRKDSAYVRLAPLPEARISLHTDSLCKGDALGFTWEGGNSSSIQIYNNRQKVKEYSGALLSYSGPQFDAFVPQDTGRQYVIARFQTGGHVCTVHSDTLWFYVRATDAVRIVATKIHAFNQEDQQAYALDSLLQTPQIHSLNLRQYAGLGVFKDAQQVWRFRPSWAGVGQHTLSYKVQWGDCEVTQTFPLIVNDSSTLIRNLSQDTAFCANLEEVSLSIQAFQYPVGNLAHDALPSCTNCLYVKERAYFDVFGGLELYQIDTLGQAWAVPPTLVQKALPPHSLPSNFNLPLPLHKLYPKHLPAGQYELRAQRRRMRYEVYASKQSTWIDTVYTVEPLIYADSSRFFRFTVKEEVPRPIQTSVSRYYCKEQPVVLTLQNTSNTQYIWGVGTQQIQPTVSSELSPFGTGLTLLPTSHLLQDSVTSLWVVGQYNYCESDTLRIDLEPHAPIHLTSMFWQDTLCWSLAPQKVDYQPSGGYVIAYGHAQPSSAWVIEQPGNQLIEYVYTDSATACVARDTQQVYIHSKTNIEYSLSQRQTLCRSTAVQNLEAYLWKHGQRDTSYVGFTGAGVQYIRGKAYWNPRQCVGLDSVWITWQGKGSDACIIRDSLLLFLQDELVPTQLLTFDSVNTVCPSSPSFPLLVMPNDGIWEAGAYSGLNIQSGQAWYTPTQAQHLGVGEDTLRYIRQGRFCRDTTTIYMRNQRPYSGVQFTSVNSSYCSNSTRVPLALQGASTLHNVVFDGVGVDSSYWYPNTISVYNTSGTDTIQLLGMYGDSVGCTHSVIQEVTLHEPEPFPTVQFVGNRSSKHPFYCSNHQGLSIEALLPAQTTLQLLGDTQVWQHQGAWPLEFQSAGQDTVLSFRFIDNHNCSQQLDTTLHIERPPLITPSWDSLFCENGSAILLSAQGVLGGQSVSGSFSYQVNGQLATHLIPANGYLIPQQNTVEVAFEEQVTGWRKAACRVDTTFLFAIEASPVLAPLSLDSMYCVDALPQPISLQAQNHLGQSIQGHYQVIGQSIRQDHSGNYFFNPALAPVNVKNKVQVIFQSLTGAQCRDTISKEIIVNDLPDIRISNLSTLYCPDDSPFLLKDTLINYNNIGLGITSILGKGVQGNLYNPQLVGVGQRDTVQIAFMEQYTGCTDTTSYEVTISPFPNTDFVWADSVALCQGKQNVRLVATGGPLLSQFKFDFNSDGSIEVDSLYGGQASFSLDKYTGHHRVYHKATNVHLCTAIDSIDIWISPSPEIYASGDYFCTNQQTTWKSKIKLDTTSIHSALKNIRWSFGDGSYDSTRFVTHQYAQAGFYPVQLQVETDSACTSSWKDTIEVLRPPVAHFSWARDCLGQNLQLTNTSKGKRPLAATWRYETNVDTSWSTSYSFLDTGVYRVVLAVYNDSMCVDSIAQQVRIYPYKEDYPTVYTFDGAEENWWSTQLGGVYWLNTGTHWEVFSDSVGEAILYSPCFNLKDIRRPKLSLDIKLNLADYLEGVIIEYRGYSGQWQVLGDNLNTSLTNNWYNSQPAYAPSNQLSTHGIGWTGQSDWMRASIALDSLSTMEYVQFRIRVKAGRATTNKTHLLSIDNFGLSSRRNSVLIEQFSRTQDLLIAELYDLQNQYAEDIQIVEYFDLQSNVHWHPRARWYHLATNTTQLPFSVVQGNIYRGETLTQGKLAFELQDLCASILDDPQLTIQAIGNSITFSGYTDIENKAWWALEVAYHNPRRVAQKWLTPLEGILLQLNTPQEIQATTATNSYILIILQNTETKQIEQVFTYDPNRILATNNWRIGRSKKEENPYQVLPNPVHSTLKVRRNKKSKAYPVNRVNWQIINTQASCVHTGMSPVDNAFEISVESLIAGHYWLIIEVGPHEEKYVIPFIKK